MIVYSERTDVADVQAELGSIRRTSDPLEQFIRFAQLESAVTDALCPERDDQPGPVAEMRQVTDTLGAAALNGRCVAVPPLTSLPPTVMLSVPEGYAYYALYPETYAEAARSCHAEFNFPACTVIGLRSIGTGLASFAAAALRSRGVDVRTLTVRPRGHPFDRYLVLSADLEEVIRRSSWILLVDEGPGISGSSLTGCARRMVELGISEERVVLLPSWNAPAEVLRSDTARQIWPRHRKYVVERDFSRLGEDLGAGNWRVRLLESESEWPAVQPQHERRKFLDNDRVLHKFAGLAHFGRRKLERARRLATAGFSPEPLAFEDGFLSARFMPGHPAVPPVERIAEYVAFIAREFPSTRTLDAQSMERMIEVNTGEEIRADLPEVRMTNIDGRMLPYEWILSGRRYLKTDALDHHDDHFFPGPQDIAWDIAGAVVECRIDEDALVELYRKRSGDRTISERMPFYTVAYLAYRIGYATMAAESLGGSPDGLRFRGLAEDYRHALRATALRRLSRSIA